MQQCKAVITRQLRKGIHERLNEEQLGRHKASGWVQMCWPGTQKVIELLSRKCSTCCQFAYRQPSDPVTSSPPPDFSLKMVEIDLCEQSGVSYLVA
ncbi:hypothetical protein HPB48_004236 [Haemaphysalis longicornis]|uniref:Integrase zinc-binding domain-containing protein n=1 Tax=Haemaphysalis longicornis TaxID=44386 RepID=A0A9J6GB17_HAELO|nr:hypothetical protein HPB48_004236 [Haemaphysalis longicornis]